MKSVIIIAIAFVLLIPLSVFAQGSLDCPKGSYHGLDNAGNEACRDVNTNQVVKVPSANTIDLPIKDISEIPINDTTLLLGIIGILISIIIIILAKRSKTRSTNWKRKQQSHRKPRKKMSVKTIVRIIGVAILIVGILFGMKIEQGSVDFQENLLIFFGLLIIGFVMIVQLKGLQNLATPNCQCCDCQNCDRNHNHWTHREGDDRHHRGW